jgi:2-methylisocitrate lyase-like PEP mutase family enzyme
MHHGPEVLVLPNVWDIVSAPIFAEAGFEALATSSTAVAATLGYADGERTPRDEMFAAVSRVVSSVDVPVSADIEAGYGLDPDELVDRLLAAGAVGCNLEDTDPRSGALKDPRRHADWLHEVCVAAADDLVVNARVDVYLHRGATDEAVRRGRLYLEAGVDCVYPIFAPADQLPTLVSGIGGPINVHDQPDGPSLGELRGLGVARVSFGGGLHASVVEEIRRLAADLDRRRSEQRR